MIENAAVFVNGHRKYKNVNVEVEPEWIIVKNRIDGSELTRYSVVEIALAGMAWDITVSDETRQRLVVQQGCGCTGMHPYSESSEYSGAIADLRRRR